MMGLELRNYMNHLIGNWKWHLKWMKTKIRIILCFQQTSLNLTSRSPPPWQRLKNMGTM